MDRRKAIKNTGLFFGLSISAASVSALFQSCQKESRLEWQPTFLTEEQAEIVSAITDAILPQSDTPGALDLKVDMFVDLMFGKALSPNDQDHTMQGYEKFVSTCNQMTGKNFSDLDREEQEKVLEHIGQQTNTFNPSIWGSTLGVQAPLDFYRRVRQFTLLGYFTSEEIGKNVLAYDPIPGEYKACTDLNDMDHTWSI